MILKNLKIKNFFFYVISGLFFIILLESLSCLGLFSYYKYLEVKGKRNYSSNLINNLSIKNHPIFSKEIGYKSNYVFDPFITSRYGSNTLYSENLKVGKHGFIINNNREYKLYDDNLTKIALLGGSSVAGTGVNNYCTISAQLEKLINDNNNNMRFEVINAGIGGSYSPKQLVLFAIELIHLDLDYIVSLDGFNDFWHSYYETHDSANYKGKAIPNRTQYQLDIFNKKKSFTKYDYQKLYPNLSKIFWYSGQFVFGFNNFLNNEKKNISNDNPWLDISILAMEKKYKDFSHADFFVSNWVSLYSIAKNHQINSLFFLQPVIPVSKKKLTMAEKKKYLAFFESQNHLELTEYEKKISIFYKKSFERINDFKKKIPTSEAEKFVDISNLFDDEKDTVFYDMVHYVEKGNNLIAKEILKKLNNHYKLDLNNNVEIKNCIK